MIARLLLAAAGLLFGTGALAQVPPQKEYYVGEGQVDLYRGTFLYGNDDISIGQDGPAQLKLTRRYGVREQGGPFGPTTGHNYEVRLYREGFVEEPNGPNQKSYRFYLMIGDFVETFEQNYPDSTVRYTGGNPGIQALALSSATGPFTYTGPNGLVIQFSALGTYSQCQLVGFPTVSCGPATSLTQPDGTQLDFTYDVASPGYARLRLVKNNFGYALGFNYVSSTSHSILQVCAINLTASYVTASAPCPAGAASASYAYTSSYVSSFTDPAGQVTSYTYPAGLQTIKSPGSTTADVTIGYYPLSGKVSSLTYADGSVQTYSYSWNNDPWINGGLNAETIVTGPGTQVTKHRFTAGSKPTKVIDPLNREKNFQYTYASLAQVTQRETEPEGNYTHYTYGTRANVTETRRVAKAGTGLPDIVTTATYAASCANVKTCDKPLTKTDARGAVTTFTYDNAHGGALTETAPAVGGIQPQKRYIYVQRYAWIKNSGGSYVQAATPVWLLSQARYCRTTATVSGACQGGTADEVVTSYDYGPNSGPNNLLLRGEVVTADGISLRTCYGYDAKGNRIWQTTPRAGLRSCT